MHRAHAALREPMWGTIHVQSRLHTRCPMCGPRPVPHHTAGGTLCEISCASTCPTSRRPGSHFPMDGRATGAERSPRRSSSKRCRPIRIRWGRTTSSCSPPGLWVAPQRRTAGGCRSERRARLPEASRSRTLVGRRPTHSVALVSRLSSSQASQPTPTRATCSRSKPTGARRSLGSMSGQARATTPSRTRSRPCVLPTTATRPSPTAPPARPV